MIRKISLLSIILMLGSPARSQMQSATDSLVQQGTLHNCVRYALAHQPSLQQSRLDEEITERSLQGKLADWYPQLKLNFTVQHYPQVPVSIVQGAPVKVSLQNSSTGQLSLTQTLFDKDVLLASSSASDVRDRVRQETISNSIDVVVNVSKAYYSTLVTQKQIELLDEDIVRLEQSLKDAHAQYQGGVVDKTDYMRATILLNNARAERRQSEELLKARYASLKDLMGYPSNAEIILNYDSPQMEHEAILDTMQTLNYDRRIEFQLLQTQKRLEEANLNYYKWSFLPSLSAYGNYSMNYQSGQFAQLFNQDYPSSFVGLQLSFPIFEGGKRIQQIKQARLELDRVEYGIVALKNFMNAEYTQAFANYRSNLNNYTVLTENLGLAQEVYHVIQLQYKAGTKTYLEVLTAERDLRSAQVNQADALFQVLSSKLDVQKALGTIQF
jgi:outer membrane protein